MAETGSVRSIVSPCIGVCTLDASGETCIGCWRSIDEISRWPTLSDDQRLATLARAEQRRRQRRARR